MTAPNFSDELPKPEVEEQICFQFLQNFSLHDLYRQTLQSIANRETKLLEIFMDDLIAYSQLRREKDIDKFPDNVKRNTSRYVIYFEKAADLLLPTPNNFYHVEEDVFDIMAQHRLSLQQAAMGNGAQLNQSDLPRVLLRRFEVRILPSEREITKTLRDIRASDIGGLIKVKGLVTRTTDVKPSVKVCTYLCDACGAELYQEITGSQFKPLDSCCSIRCKESRSLGRITLQTRGSLFCKYQELRIQELPDQVPVGHVPRSVTIHCHGEQTRKCVPGDIITVCGIFMTVRHSGYKAMLSGLQADTYVESCSIEKHKESYTDVDLDTDENIQIQAIGRDPDAYSHLAYSIAPEIYGHEDVKKALLLQLVGGSTRVLPDGMKIRGDINICLMGDPGVAKSQLLKYISTVAPRGVYTTGKGSSGVGLTAAVIRDNLTGEIALEGGALVLADMGICCIDEFDKMDENDRAAIHEVMEQQTISIAKAGITTTLNARAAVLAAANPLYGRYNKSKSVSDNIDLPNSLLSRFDLLFLILDKPDMEKDLALSKHVLHVHKFMKNPEKTVAPIAPAIIKKYIAVARTFDPIVPCGDITNYIVEAYVQLRIQDFANTSTNFTQNDQTSMTARQLLSILRLSQALARLRLSETISHEDVDEAIRLTHASKASLTDDAKSDPREDYISAIFSIMRDFAAQQGTTITAGSIECRLNYSQIEAMVLRKGFTAQQLSHCITEYSQLGVLSLEHDGSYIIFDYQ